MPSIESSGFPLVFKVTERPASAGLETDRRNRVEVEVAVRSLEGMQKEALVSLEPEGVVWRLVSDEGPYPNGKDMAPFPLAFFSCYKPISSSFRFVCDETRGNRGQGSAPPPLAYLSAGIGFCYMTQLGRYAHIKKMKLDSYRVVQQSAYLDSGIEPVDTQVFLDGDLAVEDDAVSLVRMGERTCFLHAAMRGEHPSRISVELNGEPLAERAG